MTHKTRLRPKIRELELLEEKKGQKLTVVEQNDLNFLRNIELNSCLNFNILKVQAISTIFYLKGFALESFK